MLKNNEYDNRVANGRTLALMYLILFFFLTIFVRLFYLQIIDNETYEEKAKNNVVKDIKIPPKRGTIYDRENRLVVKITSNGGFLDLEKRRIVEPPKKILDTCLKYLR